MVRTRALTGAHDRMDQGLLRAYMPEPPVLDAMVQSELERIRHLEDAGTITQAEGNAMIERAHDALDAELERRELPRCRYDCDECGGIGSHPTHRWNCSRRSR
jgi:hypothetical protein